MSKDAEYIKLINTSRWRKLRAQVLRAHPLCEECERQGYVTAATEVHHRRPVESVVGIASKERLMYDPTNLEALCHGCHAARHQSLRAETRDPKGERAQKKIRQTIADLFGASD